jgi:uncharacterized protein
MRQQKLTPSAADMYAEYHACVKDMIEHEDVLSMQRFNQHRGVDCLQHCLNVSFRSYQLCRRLGLDYRSAARGGLLHDFFLYDWHTENPYGGLHGFRHPKIAAANANRLFTLNATEQDIIRKHMWPLTPALPRHPETLVVILFDKFYCVSEALPFEGSRIMQKIYNLVNA